MGEPDTGSYERSHRTLVIWAWIGIGLAVVMVSFFVLVSMLPVIVGVLGNGPDTAGSVGTNPSVNVDLHGAGTAEAWEIVVDLDPGVAEGLISSLVTISANGGSPDLPLVEIRPGPPIEDGEPFLHSDGVGENLVEWPVEVPSDCVDGCQLRFPINITQLGEGPFARFSFRAAIVLAWEDSEAMQLALDALDEESWSPPLYPRVEIEVSGPDHDQ